MIYKFICPKCGKEKEVSMRISEYHENGHICDCGAELERNMQDVASGYICNTTGFYGKTSK